MRKKVAIIVGVAVAIAVTVIGGKNVGVIGPAVGLGVFYLIRDWGRTTG